MWQPPAELAQQPVSEASSKCRLSLGISNIFEADLGTRPLVSDAPKEAVMRILVFVISVFGLASVSTVARAQTLNPGFPVCMHVVGLGSVYDECSFFTLAECARSASSRAAQCNLNPWYRGPRNAGEGHDRPRY